MEVPIYKSGKTGRQDVNPGFLGEKVKIKTLSAAVLMYEGNKRVGTHNTLTRAEISRNKAPRFKQKGLGRGRVRHLQVSQCRGGGVAHGPHPRDYTTHLPKKERRVALKAALISKFRDAEVAMVDKFDFSAPRTKELAGILDALSCRNSALVVDVKPDRNLILSARNLRRVKVCSFGDLNAYDVVYHRALVLTASAMEALEEKHSNE